MIKRPFAKLCLVLAVGAAMLALAAPVAVADPSGPETTSFSSALAYALTHPDADAPGANDWSCHPSASHPRPVVLAHGRTENRYDNWARLAPALSRAGYCVYALNYGHETESVLGLHPAIMGLGDNRLSAKEFATFVDRVRSATGATQVDVVGHSQGVLVVRQYLRFEGGANPSNPSLNKVRTLVSISGANHGIAIPGLEPVLLKLMGVAAPIVGTGQQQVFAGSDFIGALNDGSETMPGVNYMAIATRYDEAAIPYGTSFLSAGADATVRNVTLQDGCEIDLSEHFGISYSPRTIGYVLEALDGSAPPPPCQFQPPLP